MTTPRPSVITLNISGGDIICRGGVTHPSLPTRTPSVTSDWLRYLQTCERRPSNLRNHSGLGASKFLLDLSALSSWFRRNQITHKRQSSLPLPGMAMPLPPPPNIKAAGKKWGKGSRVMFASPSEPSSVDTPPAEAASTHQKNCPNSLPANPGMKENIKVNERGSHEGVHCSRRWGAGELGRLWVRCDRGKMRRRKAALLRNASLNLKKQT